VSEQCHVLSEWLLFENNRKDKLTYKLGMETIKLQYIIILKISENRLNFVRTTIWIDLSCNNFSSIRSKNPNWTEINHESCQDKCEFITTLVSKLSISVPAKHLGIFGKCWNWHPKQRVYRRARILTSRVRH